MATKSSPRTLSATIQWVALVVIGVLALLAAFVFFGEDSTGGGGHRGLAPVATAE